MKTTKILLLSLFMLASVLSSAQIKLSFNPAKGDRYQYLCKSEQTVNQSINNGNSIASESEMTMIIDMNIKEKSKDEIIIESVYKSIAFSLSNNMISLKFDSENLVADSSEVNKLFGKILGSLVGKSFTVNIQPDGSVKSVSGVSALFEEIIADNPQLQSMAPTVKQSFGDEALKTMIEQSFKIYPDKKVKVGDVWNVNFSLPMLGGNDAEMKNTYNLQSTKNNVAQADVKSSFHFSPSANTASEGLGGELSGSQQGQIAIDIKTGMLLNSKATQIAKGKLKMQETEVLMDLTSNISIDVRKQ